MVESGALIQRTTNSEVNTAKLIKVKAKVQLRKYSHCKSENYCHIAPIFIIVFIIVSSGWNLDST